MRKLYPTVLVLSLIVTMNSCTSKPENVSSSNNNPTNSTQINEASEKELTSSDLVEKVKELESQVNKMQEESSKASSLENVNDRIPSDDFEELCQQILSEITTSVYGCSLEDNEKTNKLDIDIYYDGKFDYVSGFQCFGLSSNEFTEDVPPVTDLIIEKYSDESKFNEIYDQYQGVIENLNKPSRVIPEDQLTEKDKAPRAFVTGQYPYFIFVNCKGYVDEVHDIITKYIPN